MDPAILDTIPDTVKVGRVTGQVEKLARGRWADRWLAICVDTASIHYFLRRKDRDEGKHVRGIYPLARARVEAMLDDHYFPFLITLNTEQRIKFRTRNQSESSTWMALIRTLASSRPPSQDLLMDTLELKTSLSWTQRMVSLDSKARILTVGKSVRTSGETQVEDTYLLGGSAVREEKSYGKNFEFVVSCAPSPGGKIGELRLRANTEAQRTLWCQAIRAVSTSNAILVQEEDEEMDLEASEDVVTAKAESETKPGGEVVPLVVLEGLSATNQKVCVRLNLYLKPLHLLHTGAVSKVYHATLEKVTMALQRVGYSIISQGPDEVLCLMTESATVDLRPSCTVTQLMMALWPDQTPPPTPDARDESTPSTPTSESRSSKDSVDSPSSSSPPALKRIFLKSNSTVADNGDSAMLTGIKYCPETEL